MVSELPRLRTPRLDTRARRGYPHRHTYAVSQNALNQGTLKEDANMLATDTNGSGEVLAANAHRATKVSSFMRLGVALCLLVMSTARASADEMDLATVTPAAPGIGDATGSLGCQSFTVQLLGSPASPTMIGMIGTDFGDTVIDETSAQYSDSSIYTPSQAMGDQLGMRMGFGSNEMATLRFSFATTVINPVFHVANLDNALLDFSLSVPAGSLSVLSGNGDSTDGLSVNSALSIIEDQDATTALGVPPSNPPTAAGDRSAYGSVQIAGSYRTLDVIVRRHPDALSDDSFSIKITRDFAEFVELGSVSPGGPGTGQATGTLTGHSYSATLLGAASSPYAIGVIGTSFGHTVIDNTSPQYSYSSIYAPSLPLGDRLGLRMVSSTNETAILRFAFGAPVINPVFHVANLDNAILDFSLSVPAGGLSVISGNGDGMDGLLVNSALSTIEDDDATTAVGISPSNPPTTTGGRSAYGSVQICGSYRVLDVIIRKNPATNSDDSFNVAISGATAEVRGPAGVPALSTWGLMGMTLGLLAMGAFALRKGTGTSHRA
jgi:hypothetical protein